MRNDIGQAAHQKKQKRPLCLGYLLIVAPLKKTLVIS